jgi:ABC-type nitrate/sulfonate/bicarbonate transport system substrate-binding protein
MARAFFMEWWGMKSLSCRSLDRRGALTLLGGAAALPLMRAPAAAQNATVIRVAYIPFEASAQLFYAQELGLWTKAGLNVQLQPNPFGAAIAAAVASNAIDVGYATVMTLAAAHAKNIPFTIIAPANAFDVSQPPGGMLMSASKDVRKGPDLNGKTIGSPGLATLGEYGVRAWVDAGGGDASTLKFVEIPFSEMPAALASGRIDAAFVAEPFLTQAKKTSHTVGIEFDAIANSFLVAGWFTSETWAKAHPDAVRLFAQSMHDAADWALKNPAKCPDILAKYLKVDPVQVAATPRTYFAKTLDPAQVQTGIDLTAKYAKFATFPAKDLIYAPPARKRLL